MEETLGYDRAEESISLVFDHCITLQYQKPLVHL